MNETWYSVRCVFQQRARTDVTLRNLFEERITIWKTSSFETAIALAEREAETYAKDTDCKCIGLAQAFNLFDESVANGSEVFSLMRESNYSPKKYLDVYFDNGKERQGDVEQKPC